MTLMAKNLLTFQTGVIYLGFSGALFETLGEITDAFFRRMKYCWMTRQAHFAHQASIMTAVLYGIGVADGAQESPS